MMLTISDRLTRIIRLSETAFSMPGVGSVSEVRRFEEMVLPRITCGVDYKQGEFIGVSSKIACCAKAVSTQFLLSDVIGRTSG
jgi:hypothetical protein